MKTGNRADLKQINPIQGNLKGTRNLPEITTRFSKLRRMGDDKWMARCPAHDDRTPSLSIGRTEDRWLLNCHAGCHKEDVMAAAGLEWKDLFSQRPEYAAATMQKRRLPKVDERDIDREVIRIAKAAYKRDEPLSIEDQARVKLAIERLKDA